MTWHLLAILIAAVFGSTAVAVGVWYRRSALSREEAIAAARAFGSDLVRLPGRLRRVAADPRTPRAARWLLLGLAIYVASPIDPIPDFIPLIGHLDEVIIVPLVLVRIRRLVPPEVWADHFPARPTVNQPAPATTAGTDQCRKREP